MNIERERAEFEAWYAAPNNNGTAWEAWNRRAALQSQDRADAERYRWLRNDCLDKAHYGELAPVVFNTDDCFKHDDEALMGEALDKAIDHARRIEENNNASS